MATEVAALTADLHGLADDIASRGSERVSRAVDIAADEAREVWHWPARVPSDGQDEGDRPWEHAWGIGVAGGLLGRV